MHIDKSLIFPPGGSEFWSKPARDMAQILVAFGGYDRTELITRLISKVTIRNRLVQERHVLDVADEMLQEAIEAGLATKASTLTQPQ